MFVVVMAVIIKAVMMMIIINCIVMRLEPYQVLFDSI